MARPVWLDTFKEWQQWPNDRRRQKWMCVWSYCCRQTGDIYSLLVRTGHEGCKRSAISGPDAARDFQWAKFLNLIWQGCHSLLSSKTGRTDHQLSLTCMPWRNRLRGLRTLCVADVCREAGVLPRPHLAFLQGCSTTNPNCWVGGCRRPFQLSWINKKLETFKSIYQPLGFCATNVPLQTDRDIWYQAFWNFSALCLGNQARGWGLNVVPRGQIWIGEWPEG